MIAAPPASTCTDVIAHSFGMGAGFPCQGGNNSWRRSLRSNPVRRRLCLCLLVNGGANRSPGRILQGRLVPSKSKNTATARASRMHLCEVENRVTIGQTSAAAQKLVERGSCGAGGVVDPFGWGGGGVAVLDEGEHSGDEVVT